MPSNPHEYVIRKTRPIKAYEAHNDEFLKAMNIINEFGYQKWYGRWYTCLDYGPHRYWINNDRQGNPLLMNRALN